MLTAGSPHAHSRGACELWSPLRTAQRHPQTEYRQPPSGRPPFSKLLLLASAFWVCQWCHGVLLAAYYLLLAACCLLAHAHCCSHLMPDRAKYCQKECEQL
jgi:hypothetical protein